MTAIDRTAYPRPGARLTHEELGARYALTETDLAFIRVSARGEVGRVMLATLLLSTLPLFAQSLPGGDVAESAPGPRAVPNAGRASC